jgi:hypothetical protein
MGLAQHQVRMDPAAYPICVVAVWKQQLAQQPQGILQHGRT